jgi:hypothetical protein
MTSKRQTMNRIRSITTILCVVALVSACQSPLDTDTPRVIKPLTPAVKVVPTTVEWKFSTTTGDYSVSGQPTVLLDTSVTQVRLWIEGTMVVTPKPNTTPMIENFHLNLDSAAANGYITALVGDQLRMTLRPYADQPPVTNVPADLVNNTADALIAEHERGSVTEPRRFTVSLYLVANKSGFFAGAPQEQILGTIEITL